MFLGPDATSKTILARTHLAPTFSSRGSDHQRQRTSQPAYSGRERPNISATTFRRAFVLILSWQSRRCSSLLPGRFRRIERLPASLPAKKTTAVCKPPLLVAV